MSGGRVLLEARIGQARRTKATSGRFGGRQSVDSRLPISRLSASQPPFRWVLNGAEALMFTMASVCMACFCSANHRRSQVLGQDDGMANACFRRQPTDRLDRLHHFRVSTLAPVQLAWAAR